MGGGYVLDFTDRTFAEFFRDYGQIDDPKYSIEGGSKAKRLRYFLRITPPPLSGKVLAALLEYCLASSAEVDPGAWDTAAKVAARLGGIPPRVEYPRPGATAAMTEQELLARSLRPEAVAAATRDPRDGRDRARPLAGGRAMPKRRCMPASLTAGPASS